MISTEKENQDVTLKKLTLFVKEVFSCMSCVYGLLLIKSAQEKLDGLFLLTILIVMLSVWFGFFRKSFLQGGLCFLLCGYLVFRFGVNIQSTMNFIADWFVWLNI